MNYKLLLPSYLARFRFVMGALAHADGPIGRMLNLGTGEGDYDRALAGQCRELYACDVNAEDVEHAKKTNGDVSSLTYAVEDGEALSYGDAFFDAVVCTEVIEHVEHPLGLLAEIARVLRPGGLAIITCPSHRFPRVYDPLNSLLRPLGVRLPLGAYGYGHTELVRVEALREQVTNAGLVVLSTSLLSKSLAAALECYWPGTLQRLLKANAENRDGHSSPRRALRPSAEDPPLLALADGLVALDALLFAKSERSIGVGLIARRV